MKVSLPAIIHKDQPGIVFMCSGAKSLAEAWELYLGWPDQAEIDEAKSKGFKAIWADISIPV